MLLQAWEGCLVIAPPCLPASVISVKVLVIYVTVFVCTNDFFSLFSICITLISLFLLFQLYVLSSIILDVIMSYFESLSYTLLLLPPCCTLTVTHTFLNHIFYLSHVCMLL